MDISHLLNRELAVWRTVTADDGAGGQSSTRVQHGTVPAKVDQPSATEQMVAMQAGSGHSHSIYLLPDADVRRGDELRGADEGGATQTFRVLAVVRPSAPVYAKALCELTQEGN
ncbi:head-tail adaptor protein [Streptomyces sp. MRC013]|uniref:phage head completion protein n=1 Tax=Streptomyces sp. MRC013 TaxID=2898276 RepID=UPI002025E7EB|nr:head-tail adaptor protein [Streptomyces sp. MRC013]URM90415.1 head-tail adaptor protein [Streptomyces sp. MRC013]